MGNYLTTNDKTEQDTDCDALYSVVTNQHLGGGPEEAPLHMVIMHRFN